MKTKLKLFLILPSFSIQWTNRLAMTAQEFPQLSNVSNNYAVTT